VGYAAALVAVRLAAVAAGSWLGCEAAGDSVRPEHRRVFWLSQITQVRVHEASHIVGSQGRLCLMTDIKVQD
jgi:hypothetical protein